MKPWKFALLLPVFLLAGCLMFASEIDQAADKIGSGVDQYCLTMSALERQAVRAQVNPTPGGATIRVTCPGDE